MADYTAPVRDMTLALKLGGLDTVASLPGYEEASPDLVGAVLEEAARFGKDALAPLNEVADREGCVLENGAVRTYTGLKDFYAQYIEAGWNAIPFEPEFGGQGLPWMVAAAVQEVWQSANMAFALCPMLSLGAIELLTQHGSDAQKATFLPKMVSGEWPGTMNLTEPQAGSDLAQVRAKAVPQGDGTYRITGTKIFITFGDHDLSDNIVHMVLARTPDAPPGVKGISLFLVPKVLVNDDGSLGARNDVVPASIEHKLGIHGSPTAVMAFGDNDGAIGTLIGEENKGLAYMFTMMNNARLQVGLQGYAVAERAYQHAAAYAKDRVQSKPVTGATSGPATIIHHPDVRRMLMSMKSMTQAARLLTYSAFGSLDLQLKASDPDVVARASARVALLTPVVKLWGTEVGVEVANLAVQVFGGVGYVEETGAAQFYRDARIAPIYEGTNGIQAADLVGRKILKDGGAEMAILIQEMRDSLPTLDATVADALGTAIDAMEQATAYVVQAGPADAFGAATPFARLVGMTVGGWLLGRAAQQAEGLDFGPDFVTEKQTVARFFARHHLCLVPGLAADAMAGADDMMALPEDAF